NVDFGPDVAELIDILKTLGYEFGQETIIYNQSQPYYTQIVREAVMDFQSKNKLTPDGVVNDKTAKKLKKKAKKK
ncbi:MAG: peptidoglycan-binding protein, partial [Bacteroides sp.]|nr:peptidoglycan-binding protein [Bacteroides sp.]